jgi:hypothetical protein
MNSPDQIVGRFFRVVGSRQGYLNLIYLLLAFPLGVFYFVFLVTGLSLGISLSIVWVGIPILLVVGIGWWALANFECFMARYWLNEDIPLMEQPFSKGGDLWERLKGVLANPVTWKSPLYLFLKFPLGIASFVILITSLSLTLAFLIMPFTYQHLPNFQVGVGVFFGGGLSGWRVDSMNDALVCSLIGLMLWPVTLHISNGLARVHARFARVMLSADPLGRLTAIVRAT